MSTYGQRSVVGYVITKFPGTDGSPNFLIRGAPLRSLLARESSTITLEEKCGYSLSNDPLCSRRNQASNSLVSLNMSRTYVPKTERSGIFFFSDDESNTPSVIDPEESLPGCRRNVTG